MADVFMSFKRADYDRVMPLAEKLQGLGYSVWHRPAATEAIDPASTARELAAARCVLVCWSQHSAACLDIRAEAADARARGVLAACRLDSAAPPPPFDRPSVESLAEWRGDSRHDGWQRLSVAIGERVRGGPPAPEPVAVASPATVRQAPPRKLLLPLAAAALIGLGGALLLRPGVDRGPSPAAVTISDGARLAHITNQLAVITARFSAVQAQLPRNDARRIRAELNAVVEIVALLSARVDVQTTVNAADWVTPENALALLAEDLAALEAGLGAPRSTPSSPKRPPAIAAVAQAKPAVSAIEPPAAPPPVEPIATAPISPASPAPEQAAAATPASTAPTEAAAPTATPEPRPADPPQPQVQPQP